MIVGAGGCRRSGSSRDDARARARLRRASALNHVLDATSTG
jgi:hypothetical protein